MCGVELALIDLLVGALAIFLASLGWSLFFAEMRARKNAERLHGLVSDAQVWNMPTAEDYALSREDGEPIPSSSLPAMAPADPQSDYIERDVIPVVAEDLMTMSEREGDPLEREEALEEAKAIVAAGLDGRASA